VVQAIESGPDWSTTAIFITYDDCGCFYDHVAPPSPELGIRVPMVVVSPFARRGFTDTNVASYASLLAFTEYVFGLQPLADADANAGRGGCINVCGAVVAVRVSEATFTPFGVRLRRASRRVLVVRTT
jgi:hypothetical protein